MLIIRNHKIVVHNAPKEIYNNPKSKYVAALFDDVNEIIVNSKHVLLYPHQIKIIDNSNSIAIVKNAYFKGSFWLIEAEFENQLVFLNHKDFIETNTKIKLSLEF